MLSGDKMKVNSKMSHEAAEVNILFKKSLISQDKEQFYWYSGGRCHWKAAVYTEHKFRFTRVMVSQVLHPCSIIFPLGKYKAIYSHLAVALFVHCSDNKSTRKWKQ